MATLLAEWGQRPQDVANLLNPAFDGLLLYRAVAGYEQENEGGMPFELAFMVLPFVLHQPTRKRLPAIALAALQASLVNCIDAA